MTFHRGHFGWESYIKLDLTTGYESDGMFKVADVLWQEKQLQEEKKLGLA